MTHSGYNAPHLSRYPDDFDDLREDGWTVYTAEDGGDLPHVLLLPPGVVDDPGYVPGPGHSASYLRWLCLG